MNVRGIALHKDGPYTSMCLSATLGLPYHEVLPLEFRLDFLGLLLLSSVTSCVTLGCVFPTSQLQVGSSPTSPFGQASAESRSAR